MNSKTYSYANHKTSEIAFQEQLSQFEKLIEQSADRAYNFAFRLCGNDQDARDLVQEAFARAFEHRDRFDSTRPFNAWLNRILHNVFIDRVRRYEYKHSVSMDAPLKKDEEGSWDQIIQGKDEEPLETLARAEDEKLLQNALNRLPVHYRTAVVLYDIEQMSYDEIGKIMDCPIGTVSSRIHQGRLLLKKILTAKENKGLKLNE
ncbi:MAG: RNA polymerase sigma factor [Elusimicrobiota bacterium]